MKQTVIMPLFKLEQEGAADVVFIVLFERDLDGRVLAPLPGRTFTRVEIMRATGEVRISPGA